MTAQVLMVQGTASSVGKSLLVTALCRILRQDGLHVAPFKAQNMSNNSYVTRDGGEIGRAQVNQAEAAGAEASTDMNPILLKPESDHRSQIVLNGRAYRSAGAAEYFRLKSTLWPAVTSALDRLRADYDAVIVEGAGSPAEINLKQSDIVNMRVARYAQAPVLLVGDIDRGGVFAHLVGTLELLEPDERRYIQAFVINKFRGDATLLAPGLKMLEARTEIPVAGVLPFLHDIGLPEEDAATLDDVGVPAPADLDIAVIRLPHVSNFDDLDPLAAEPDVCLRYVGRAAEIGEPDLVVLPGSKATIADLAWLRDQGLADAILDRSRCGSAVIGVCGGYQMLGKSILDLQSVESPVRSVDGIGLLNAVTHFERAKTTHRAIARVTEWRGILAGTEGSVVSGYEIHMGRSRFDGTAPFKVERRSEVACAAPDGALSPDGWVLGTYLHGLFANDALRSAMLVNLMARKGKRRQIATDAVDRDAAYERLAAAVRPALNMRLIRDLMRRTAALPTPLGTV